MDDPNLSGVRIAMCPERVALTRHRPGRPRHGRGGGVRHSSHPPLPRRSRLRVPLAPGFPFWVRSALLHIYPPPVVGVLRCVSRAAGVLEIFTC
ncbi:hypothetical protein CcI156_16325 [Frankia sp. CcI156]|nr:hypothetical protein CcI156_16325 [Frankia sp. CcI156]